jgi:hypothetical protein
MAYVAPVVPASGTTFAQFQAGGISAMVERQIALLVSGGTTPVRISLLRAARAGNLQRVYKKLSTLVEEWNAGRPMVGADAELKLADLHIVFIALAQACQEAGGLMDANPGTLGSKPTPLNVAQAVRTWP